MLEIFLTIVYILWPFGWLIVLFLRGYARVQYPEAFPGIGPFDEEALQKTKKKGWTIITISLIAIAAWYVVPIFLFP